ncbi:MAG: Flp family type IVb pilin [Alphaproteobacteria bacterium]|jgi:Flp pilus assembly pilin Flp|nr:Flp family type IVb pilin [Alphaproteobacteria bacterium]
MCGLKQNLARLWNDESGISSVEYALLLAFVAAGIIVAAETLGNAVQNEMTDTATCIETNGATCN